MFKEIKRYESMYLEGAFKGNLAKELAKEAMKTSKIHFIKRYKLFQSAELASNIYVKTCFISDLMEGIRNKTLTFESETFYEPDDWRNHV